MTTQPTHVGASIRAAVDALTQPPTLAQQCAALDPQNPHAIEHWDMRVRQILRYRGGQEALRCLLYEVASRRSDLQARSKGCSNAIARPAAWLNAQSLKWLNAARARAANERNQP